MPLTFADLHNASSLEFSSLESEEWREYAFADFRVIRIERPVALNVSRGGGHRLLDHTGISHYVPKGWVHLRWRAKPDAPHFDF